MKKLFLGTLLVVLVLAAAVTYSVSQHKTAHIIISGNIFAVELAETPSTQERGLSGRPSLPDDNGMLFVFDHEDYWGFWMIDMKFHLDIIWFDSNRQVVFIESNIPPCTPQNCPVFIPNARALYVLEVNAGFVAAQRQN